MTQKIEREPIPDAHLIAAGISPGDRLTIRQLEQCDRPWSQAEFAYYQRIALSVGRAIS